MPTVVDLLAVSHPAQSLQELPEGEVQGGEWILGTGLGPDHRAFVTNSDLHAFALTGLPGVALVGQLDVDPVRAGVELGDLHQFLLGLPPEPF
jgi:hypothetical protein